MGDFLLIFISFKRSLREHINHVFFESLWTVWVGPFNLSGINCWTVALREIWFEVQQPIYTNKRPIKHIAHMKNSCLYSIWNFLIMKFWRKLLEYYISRFDNTLKWHDHKLELISPWFNVYKAPFCEIIMHTS